MGANGTSRPNTVAAITAMAIARTRPMRSATTDQGITPIARPMVDAETTSAESAALTRRSSARWASTAWGEYNCAKVAMPAKKSPASSRR